MNKIFQFIRVLYFFPLIKPKVIGFDVFEWAGCTGWSNPIASSSDLWCENPIISSQTPPFIPGVGYQFPHSGENMSGILINGGTIISYREFIQNELVSTLENNVTYDIEFYISGNTTECISNSFEIKFFSSKYTDLSQLWLSNFVPDASNDISTFSTDTSIWQKVEMKYIANGTEKFILIGNFQDSLTTSNTLPCDTTGWGNQITIGSGYFFIDDVSITKTPPYAKVPNVFSANNDGINDFFTPKVYNVDNWEMSIMNRWGNKVINLNQDNSTWNGTDAIEGIYFYEIHSEFEVIDHGYITVIR